MYIENTQTEEILQHIKAQNPTADATFMLLFGEASQVNIPLLIESLNKEKIAFFGGIFPGIIYANKNYTKGCILKKLSLSEPPILIKGLDQTNFELPKLPLATQGKVSILTFVDGLTSNISGYLQKLYHHFGDSANFLGGGAGSLSLVQKPCLFCPEGFFQDAALLCVVDLKVSLGVRHGWKKMLGPMVATRTEKNTIYELNWTEAFEVYKEAVEADQAIKFNDENFFDIAKGYPFGIFKESGEDVVRDPIAVGKNGELICVGAVPENTVLYILKGENQSLIASAHKAVEICLDHTPKAIQHTLVVDCISRTLFLEEEFGKELQAIHQSIRSPHAEALPQGVLSLGEISSDGDGFLEFFNKTLVVGTLY
ncbi:MAG: FIST C-terminal domain-containing protein [Bacteroidota bacterium]